MVNIKLLEIITLEKLIEMGFKEENDGTGDPRGIDWNIRNDNFHLMIDPWAEVKLARCNPDSDFITIHCEDLMDLRAIIDFIAD